MNEIFVAAIESGSTLVIMLGFGAFLVRATVPLVERYLDIHARQVELLGRLAGIVDGFVEEIENFKVGD